MKVESGKKSRELKTAVWTATVHFHLSTIHFAQPHLLGFLHHILIGGIVLVGDDAVEDGILDAALEGTHLGTGG